MKKIITLCLLFCLSVVAVAIAGPGTPLVTERAGNAVQAPAPNPLTTYLVADNYSHTVALYPSVLWFSLTYNGSATCQVRLMNTVTKSSWVQMPVQPQSSFSRVVHSNAGFLNYSNCNGGTGQNTVLEMM